MGVQSTRARPQGPPGGPGLLLQKQEESRGRHNLPQALERPLRLTQWQKWGPEAGVPGALRLPMRRSTQKYAFPLRGDKPSLGKSPGCQQWPCLGRGHFIFPLCASVIACGWPQPRVAFQWDPGTQLPFLPGSCPGGCVMQPASKHPPLPLALSSPGPSHSSPTTAATLPGSRVQHRG